VAKSPAFFMNSSCIFCNAFCARLASSSGTPAFLIASTPRLRALRTETFAASPALCAIFPTSRLVSVVISGIGTIRVSPSSLGLNPRGDSEMALATELFKAASYNSTASVCESRAATAPRCCSGVGSPYASTVRFSSIPGLALPTRNLPRSRSKDSKAISMAFSISDRSYSEPGGDEPSDPPRVSIASSSESSRTDAEALPDFFFFPRRHARALACAGGREKAASRRTTCAADPPTALRRGWGTPAIDANETRDAGEARRPGEARAWTHSASARAARRVAIVATAIGRAVARGRQSFPDEVVDAVTRPRHPEGKTTPTPDSPTRRPRFLLISGRVVGQRGATTLFKPRPPPRHNAAHNEDRACAMASVAVMSTRTLCPTTAFARRDAGVTSCRGDTCDRRIRCSRDSPRDDSSSLASRRAVATRIDRDGLTARTARRVVTVTPRAAARDFTDETSFGTPSQTPRASSPRALWELAGRSPDVTRGVGVRVGASPSPPPWSPTIAAGLALLGGVAFAAASRRAASQREELELQRRFRGELIRRRLKTAVGSERSGRAEPFANGGDGSRSDDPTSFGEYREIDYAGDRVMSARDIAFARTAGFVRSDQSESGLEDAAFLRESAARRDGRAAASRGTTARRTQPVAPTARVPSRPSPSRADDGTTGQLVQVTLGATYRAEPGQTLRCTGGAPALGGWDLRFSVPLDRVGADRWQCVLSVPFGSLEYRYVLATSMRTGETRMESELGKVRSRAVVSDFGQQLFVEETPPAFASAAGGPPGADANAGPTGGASAASRLAHKYAVDVDAALEILELARGNESAADKMLAAASRGLSGGVNPSDVSRSARDSAETLRDGRRRRSFSSDVDVAERLRGARRGGQLAAAAAAMGVPSSGDDKSEVAMNEDVTVVEDFTDVSDDDLARLVADLQRELGK